MRVNGKVVGLEQKDLKNKIDDYSKRTMVLPKQDLVSCSKNGNLIIKPFEEKNLGPCDINLRISRKFARMNNNIRTLDIFDDLKDISAYFELLEDDEYIIYPNEHLLIESLEYVEIPTDLTADIKLRSTFSRLGLNTPPTTIDPGFKGKIMFHIIGSSFPIKLHAGVAVFKVIFMPVCPNTESYKGKYQNQEGVVLPKKDSCWKRGD
jgi:deoxycytidine triphosphate deaminase